MQSAKETERGREKEVNQPKKPGDKSNMVNACSVGVAGKGEEMESRKGDSAS